jgi:hypothetical protein
MNCKVSQLSRRTALASTFAGVLSLVLMDGLPLPAQLLGFSSSSSTGISYSGRATVVNITDIHNVPGPIVICDTGPLPSSGGFLEATVMQTNVANGELTLELAHATTSGDGPVTISQSSVNNFVVNILATDGTESTLRADFIGAQAMASCRPNGKVDVSGSVTIEGLVLNGQAVVVTKRANQVVTFPGGKIIINEQSSSVSGNTGYISVTPLHIIVEGCMNGVIGNVNAGITCNTTTPPPPTSECGKLTGGGWIVTPSGEKGTFGVSGGIRRGQFWGHLNYIDHSNGMHVRSTSVTGFSVDPNDPDCRIITYNVLIDGVSGTATVHACDKGEPGRNDLFDITLSNGYHAGGDLGGNDPGGGNIQLHKCPPGWM